MLSALHVFLNLDRKDNMMMPWSTILCVLILVGAFALTALNVVVVGGFVGRATTVHPDLDNIKGRKTSKSIISLNALLAVLFLVLLVLYAGSLGWKSYNNYAISKGCDLGGGNDSLPAA
jgi:type III secretory pathway component EscU